MLCLRVLFIFNLLYVGRSVRIEFLNTLGGPIWLGGQAKSGYPLPHGGGWALDKDERVSNNLRKYA